MRILRRCTLGPWLVRPFLVVLCARILTAVPAVNGAVEYALSVEGVTEGRLPAFGFGHTVTPSPAGAVGHGDVLLTKPVDRASPQLLSRLCSGPPIPRVLIEARESTADRVRYHAIRLLDVLVSSYSVSAASATNDPVESVSFNYSLIEWTSIETDVTGFPGFALSTLWSVPAGMGGVSDPDSDGDGIPDSYEVSQTLKPLLNDADEDSDTDGMPNGKEYLSGTAAGDSNSVFRVTGISRPGGGSVLCTVTFNSVPGRVYDLYASDTLTSLPMPVHTVAATETTTRIDLTLPAPQTFVRVIIRVP